MASAEMRDLIHALNERNIDLGEDDVAWAFEGPKTRNKAVQWVQEYLQPATLLTKEELSFYERHGIDTNTKPAGHGRPLSEVELETAMECLEESTAALERQGEMLGKQKIALRKLQSQSSKARAGSHGSDTQHTKFAHEKAQLDFNIDDLSSATTDLLRASMKQIESSTGGIPSNVDRLLEKDDRLLDGLQKLLPKLSDSASDIDEADEVEQLCSTLSLLSIQEIQTRLDRVYKDSMVDFSRKRAPPKDFTDQQAKQRETLRAELHELAGEIDGLVGIVVDHQYRKSLKRGLMSARADRNMQKAKWSEYTVAALLYLISRLDAIGEHILRLNAHESTLRAISSTLDEALASEQAKAGARAPTSPMPNKVELKGLKPLRLVQANISETQDPAVTFLKEHDIRAPGTVGVEKLTPLLAIHSREQKEKLARLASSTETGIADAIAQSIAKSHADLQELQSAVMAHTTHGTVKLVDSNVQAHMGELERDIQRLGDEMRVLDIDAIAKMTREKQDAVRKRSVE
ncbi:uncharacterized protein MYCFIDRAFT_81145 [Pseudocercospora fijiensis CIRAD86]|uniref:HAUS augmin-like complex subunit 3 N-terminal domain-containing protein n=1 Tax=Pseudocercospora fijiensis (strain CIRAD86) TaxID=383855 RepID=M3A4X9_PSEFD|nr:uncharacterized protein MYCFIDRAFT_81145 [Pseudocercospora fijiensis CIRAD86]EME79661.1 hypothetical protein MYCFIDRAFT_81145 [Pseudocercospora fijiensis CIRAD86]